MSEDSYILVTGAAGFIGSRLVESLVRQGRSVLAVDCFLEALYPSSVKRWRWDKLRDLATSNLALLEFDLASENYDLMREFHITSVINQAALPGLLNGAAFVEPYYRNNLLALNRLLDFCTNMPIKCFVHASTSSVYGRLAIGAENGAIQPASIYGVSKVAAEKLLGTYHELHGIPHTILRYFSVYGPNQRPDMAYSKIIKAVLSGKEFTIFGDGTQKRSNTYIDDVVEATLLAEQGRQNSSIFNVCGDETLSLMEAIQVIEEVTGKKLNYSIGKSRTGDQKETSGSNKKIKEQLGWKPSTSFRTGIENQLEWELGLNNS